MIDYLMQTGNMNAMINGPGKLNPDGRGRLYDPTTGTWRSDVCFLCQVNDYTDPAAPVPVNGVFLWIAFPEYTKTIWGSGSCVLAADREKALARDPSYLLYSTMTEAQRAVRKITPVMHGAHYPFMDQ